ncbi:hypothetical protein FRC05_003268 [Tulasnella sp. 425]|nr:hypothetical protein FRC05_003268 [Tulasnella sp. 425]
MRKPSPDPKGFNTLEREYSFRHPPKDASTLPIFQELVGPQINSVDALFEDPKGTEQGLVHESLKYIPEKVVFDKIGEDGVDLGKAKGSRLSCKPEVALVVELVFITRFHATLVRITGVSLGRPMVPEKDRESKERRIFPSECRERRVSYAARMTAKISWDVNGGTVKEEVRDCGMVPIMVRSNRCNITGLSSAELVSRHEEAEEFGGYFIINGNERLIRYLILPRRNYPMAVTRNSFQNRGPTYTRYGVSIRCVRTDQQAMTNTLHYCTNGSAMLRFYWYKNEYMIPIILLLKALIGAPDKEIFESVMMEDYQNTFMTDRVELLLRSFKSYKLYSQKQCLEFLGERFRVVLGLPEDYTNQQLGLELLDRVLLVHLDSSTDKYRLLIFMLRKLLALVSGACCDDNPDSPANHEVMMPGYLYGNIIRERLENSLQAVRFDILNDLRRHPTKVNFFDTKYIQSKIRKTSWDIGAKLTNFLASGVLSSTTGLDLQQTNGFTIICEKLNWYRYLSHFRSIHRGGFFTTQRTTAVRKLLPEAWGFICPVHTPDGEPCGLLNHLARGCRIVTDKLDEEADYIPALLSGLGMTEAIAATVDGRRNHTVQIDGRIIGWATEKLCRKLADALRVWKSEKKNRVPWDLEIACIPPSNGGLYPGLYLFSGRARFMRTVRYLANGKEDSIGSLEQVYMNIAVKPEEIPTGQFTHVEVATTNFLSILASLTPFSDFNQSPRNIYQCQMGKQTMGTPSTALQHRTDNKLYRIQSPQTPIVRPDVHNEYGMDNFPNGTNAVVAVISYTGYDMEDAMILNKSAHERGFGYGSVIKSMEVDLTKERGAARYGPPKNHFGIGRDVWKEHRGRETVDTDGLPIVGGKLEPGDPIAAYVNDTTGKTGWVKYKGDEACYVETVRALGGFENEPEMQRIQITLRIPRSPVIGDKFSSRHGQKGVCSQKWPAIDMPFSESGIQPDVIINPHAFPSRMTIGMFVESMAGKAGAMHGIPQDGSPFKFSEEDRAVDYFGQQLRAAGYNYFGNEPMYSGITGEEFHADIYLGVVYYQRLRHMVLDKFQCRTTGPVEQVTRQPVGGRKKGGGVRFGEMERDALLAHGTSFLLQDRLMNCSDYSTAWVCRTCGSLISLGYEDVSLGETVLGTNAIEQSSGPLGEYCRVCRAQADDVPKREREALNGNTSRVEPQDKGDVRIAVPPGNMLGRATKGGDMDVIAIPFVFRYLCAELAAMGIKVSLEVS